MHWHGFVADLNDVYAPGSILLVPAVLPGGIKTKVLEAFSFGCAVLGNPLAFEGLDIQDYPLRLPEPDWTPYLMAPKPIRQPLKEPQRLAENSSQSPARVIYAAAWETILAGVEADEVLQS